MFCTSGSTGVPKGVCGTHCAMLNRFLWMWSEFPFRGTELACHKTSLNFVDSIFEVFGALGAGVPVLVVPEDARTDPEALVYLLARTHVTRLIAVPSLLRTMLQIRPNLGEILPRLKTWTISGEAFPVELARLFFQACSSYGAFDRNRMITTEDRSAPLRLLNLYGSTEVAADVTCLCLTEEDYLSGGLDLIDGPILPIGYPIPHTSVTIVDPETFEIMPVGEVGELFISGANLAKGYWHRDELTKNSLYAAAAAKS